MSPSTNNLSFTAAINPPGATPTLTRSHVWAGLLLKVRSAETFIPGGIKSTTVVSEGVDESGNGVVERDVVFVADGRVVRERVTVHEHCRVDFAQPQTGNLIQNVVGEDADGALYLTYVFEWRHPGVGEEELGVLREREAGLGRKSVGETVDAMRELVRSGKL